MLLCQMQCSSHPQHLAPVAQPIQGHGIAGLLHRSELHKGEALLVVDVAGHHRQGRHVGRGCIGGRHHLVEKVGDLSLGGGHRQAAHIDFASRARGLQQCMSILGGHASLLNRRHA